MKKNIFMLAGLLLSIGSASYSVSGNSPLDKDKSFKPEDIIHEKLSMIIEDFRIGNVRIKKTDITPCLAKSLKLMSEASKKQDRKAYYKAGLVLRNILKQSSNPNHYVTEVPLRIDGRRYTSLVEYTRLSFNNYLVDLLLLAMRQASSSGIENNRESKGVWSASYDTPQDRYVTSANMHGTADDNNHPRRMFEFYTP